MKSGILKSRRSQPPADPDISKCIISPYDPHTEHSVRNGKFKLFCITNCVGRHSDLETFINLNFIDSLDRSVYRANIWDHCQLFLRLHVCSPSPHTPLKEAQFPVRCDLIDYGHPWEPHAHTSNLQMLTEPVPLHNLRGEER